MDKMVFGGCLGLVGFGIFLGLAISQHQGGSSYVRSIFEILSFAGTSVTAIVAVYALTTWRKQYFHAEKHSQLKALRNAAGGLYSLSEYLSVVRIRLQAREAGYDVETISRFHQNEAQARTRWYSSLGVYISAWESVREFLTVEEEKSFLSRPDAFINMERVLVERLSNGWASLKPPQVLSRFSKISDEVLMEAEECCQRAIDEVSSLVRNHLGT